MEKKSKITQKKPHIFEIDLLRAITVFSVVAIHSLSYTNYLTTGLAATQLINLIGHALHFNREMFMFITGLVLTYVYYHRQFSTKAFWLKRVSLIFIPYVVWTIIYVFINVHSGSFLDYTKTILCDILTGDASFQLYYILLALQFYIIFPYFLFFLKKVAHHPWLTLGISFVIQLAWIYYDFTYLQSNLSSRNIWLQHAVLFQDRVIVTYQFFFILGAFAAIYMNKAQAFLIKHRWFAPVLAILAIILYIIYYYLQLNIFGDSITYATSVLQPSVVMYSVVAIIFFCWLAMIWSKQQIGYKLVKVVSDTSFGIYFVHVIALTFIAAYLLPIVPKTVPVPITDISVLLLAFASSVLFCFILLKTPLLSWTIGRAQPVQFLHNHKKKFFEIFFILLLIIIVGTVLINLFLEDSHVYRQHEVQKKVSRINIAKNAILLPIVAHIDPHSILNVPIVSTGCRVPLSVKTNFTSTIKIQSGGMERYFNIFIPSDYNSVIQSPLVLDFHGYASNGFKQEQLSLFDPLARQNNFIVIYPEGTRDKSGALAWNTGLYPSIHANDVLFVSNILNYVQSNLCIDPTRIYATGFSNGGGFVNELALTMFNRIAAFAPVSGSYVTPFNDAIKRTVSIIEFHGTEDNTNPYGGDKLRKEFSITDWIKNWVKQDKCKQTQVIYKTQNVIGYGSVGCQNQSAVVHYQLIGEHHVWPISLFKQSVDQKTQYVDAASIIWDFFQKHPLQNATIENIK